MSADRLQRWSDRLNPVLVRETRQALNGKVFRSVIMLMLGVGFLLTVIVSNADDPNGAELFFQYYWVLTLIAFVIVPFSSLQQFRTEIEGRTSELLTISALHPRAIVRGKILCMAVQLLMFYSAMVPFMAFSFLLKGIDVVTIVFFVVVTYFVAVLLCAAGLLCSTLATNRARFTLFSVISMLGLLGMYRSFVGGSHYLITNIGAGYLFSDPDARLVLAFWAVEWFSVLMILYLAASVMITFQNANRTTSLRLAFLGNFAVTTIMAAGVFWYSGWDDDILRMWMAYALLFWSVYGLFACTESRTVSKRVASEVPTSLPGRRFAMLFFPGQGSGLLTLLLGLGLSLGLYVGGSVIGSTYGMYWRNDTVKFFLAGLAYIWIYSVIGAWLKGFSWMAADSRNGFARAIVLLILTAFSILPSILQLIFFFDLRDSVVHFMNPFYMCMNVVGGFRTGSDAFHWLFGLFLAGASTLAVLYAVPQILRYTKMIKTYSLENFRIKQERNAARKKADSPVDPELPGGGDAVQPAQAD